MNVRKLVAVLTTVLMLCAAVSVSAAAFGTYFSNDIPMLKVDGFAYGGCITNGDFETGTADGMTAFAPTCVSAEAAKDGDFGLHLVNTAGNWDNVAQWTVSGLEVGTTYKLAMDVKVVSAGLNWALWQDTVDSGRKYCSGYFNITEWIRIEKEFVANSADAVLNIKGSNSGLSEEVYLDNLKITAIDPTHVCEFVGVETKAASCTEDGVMTYSCICGEGTYVEAISAIGHAYAESARVEATCGADGSVTYTCANCSDTYAQPIAATGNHIYDHEFDVNCNTCGAIRETPAFPIHYLFKSAMEMEEGEGGLAMMFSMDIAGIAIKDNTWVWADYTNATYNGHKLLEVGVVASNGAAEITIQGLRMYELENDVAKFAFRITNIPTDKFDVAISMTPYFIVEMDGVATTIYGEEQSSTYNEAFSNN